MTGLVYIIDYFQVLSMVDGSVYCHSSGGGEGGYHNTASLNV